MKKRQKEELRSKGVAGIEQEIEKLEKEIWKLKTEIGLGRIKNTSLLKRRLDDLAVLKTILREKKNVNNLSGNN
jgi:ribosomal protein L29